MPTQKCPYGGKYHVMTRFLSPTHQFECTSSVFAGEKGENLKFTSNIKAQKHWIILTGSRQLSERNTRIAGKRKENLNKFTLTGLQQVK